MRELFALLAQTQAEHGLEFEVLVTDPTAKRTAQRAQQDPTVEENVVESPASR